MEADFAVELGADDETLDFPWADSDDRLRYYDLKTHLELISEIEEARRAPELGEFLVAVNSPAGALETAKCDAWVSSEINVEEEIFQASLKFGSYVDLLFRDEERRFSFAAHEEFVKRVTSLLRVAPEIPASAQLLVRRCFYQGEAVCGGLYVSCYVFGFGDTEADARRFWGIGLKLVEKTLRQAACGTEQAIARE